jgi:alkyl hydroperoxide reductase subunit AhpC
MTTYRIILNQTTGESQTEYTSESYDEIIKHWEEEKNEQDKFSKIDMELVLHKDDEVIDEYEIIDAQREWIVID